ncbi:entericidin [Chelativorans sp. ZYF759]|uniref:entericidin domain-containing protein n=1 Tax=Chelativorans sp. ZYF759 TaxID=2692213 RepID=UPI00145ED7E3|nr:entericidin [Chelativorans sp. ZYF759]NMG38810.1 entericidin [Chelativorans sp. ZYF759]
MLTSLTRVVVILAMVGFAAGCANTIRGVGQDTAQTVDATQQAGRNVARSAQ